MATRKIILDGDATGLRAAASAATAALKAELEAQKKAMADAKAAVKALSKDATDVEKQAARDSVKATGVALDAKQKAYGEALTAAKAAAAAVKAANQEEIRAQREIVTALRATAKERAGMAGGADARAKDAAFAASGGKRPAGDSSAGGAEGQIGRGAKQFAASMFAAVAMMNRAMQALSELENKLLDKTLSANETAGKRTEAMRLAGVSQDEADALGKTIGASAGTLSSADISSALEMAATEGSGKLKGQQVVDVLRASGAGSAGSALTAASYGLGTSDSVALAERYRLQTRGGSLSREQGRSISGLMAGGQLKGAEGVADYLAAAQESGQSLTGVDASAPFMGADPRLLENFTRMRARASTRQANVSVLEAGKNSAEGTRDAALASQDQSVAVMTMNRERRREEQALLTTRDGSSADRAGLAIRDIVGIPDLKISPVASVPQKPFEVKVTNQPKQVYDR